MSAIESVVSWNSDGDMCVVVCGETGWTSTYTVGNGQAVTDICGQTWQAVGADYTCLSACTPIRGVTPDGEKFEITSNNEVTWAGVQSDAEATLSSAAAGPSEDECDCGGPKGHLPGGTRCRRE